MSQFRDISDDVTQAESKVRKKNFKKNLKKNKKTLVETCFVLEKNFQIMTQRSQLSQKKFVHFSLCSSNSVPC